MVEPDAVEEKQDGGDVAAVYDKQDGGDVTAVYDNLAGGGDAPTLPDGVMTINAPASEETAGGWVGGNLCSRPNSTDHSDVTCRYRRLTTFMAVLVC